MPKIESYIEVHAGGVQLFCTTIHDVHTQNGFPAPFALIPYAVEGTTRTILRDVRISSYVSWKVAPAQCDQPVLSALGKMQEQLEEAMRKQQLAKPPTAEEEARMKAAEKRIQLAK